MRKESGRIWTDLLIDHLQISQCLRDGFDLIQGDLKIEMYLVGYVKYISYIKYFVKDFSEELRSFFSNGQQQFKSDLHFKVCRGDFASEQCYKSQKTNLPLTRV